MSTTPTVSKTSRVGKQPIAVPSGVSASIASTEVKVKGPKGELSFALPKHVSVKQEGDSLHVACDAPGSAAPRLQGMARSVLANMVAGCAVGYERILEFHGTGYRAELKGQVLSCILGFSHIKKFNVPKGLSVEIPKDSKGTVVILRSADKHQLGQAAATIRGFRPPNPYGGKGVRYRGEHVRAKAGKAGK
jgi:large subunit ribosomal protein L6